MKLVSDFSSRLRQYMESHDNMTYENLSQITGFPSQTLNRYALRQRIPKIDDFTKISLALKVNPLWLQGFDVSKEPATITDSELWNKICDDETLLTLVRWFCNLPTDELKTARAFLDVARKSPRE